MDKKIDVFSGETIHGDELEKMVQRISRYQRMDKLFMISWKMKLWILWNFPKQKRQKDCLIF